jgi:hypothetical protein
MFSSFFVCDSDSTRPMMEASHDTRTAEQGGFIASTISSDCSSTQG